MADPPPATSPAATAERRWWALVTLFFIWLAFSLAAYYLVQNAFLRPLLQDVAGDVGWLSPGLSPAAIGRSLLDLAVALWIFLVALGSGRWLAGRLGLDTASILEEGLFSLGLGVGFLGLLVLALGLVGFLDRWLLFAVMTILTLGFARPALAYLRRVRRPRPSRLVALYLAVTLGLTFALALLPPTSWDALFYHLTGPKLYLAAGRIEPGLVEIPHLNFPSLFQMLFLLALGLRGEAAAVLLHFGFGLLVAGLVFALARRHLELRSGWTAVLFFYAMPVISLLGGWAYNDLALVFYEAAALYALLSWQGDQARRPRSWLVVAALFSGLAMSLKYTSFVAPLSLALLILWWNRRQVTAAIRPLLLFGGLAFLVAAPWFLKNLAFTGNPVYPFLWGGEDWDDFRAAAYAETGTGIAYNPTGCAPEENTYLVGQHATGCPFDPLYLAGRLLVAPIELTLGLQDASRDGDPGPLLLIFLPLVVVYAFRRSDRDRPRALPAALPVLLFFAFVQYLFWLVGVSSSAALWQTRLLLPAFVVLCPVLAWILADLARYDTSRFSLQRQLTLILGLVLAVGLLIQFLNWLPHQPWAYLTGAETRSEYLERRLGAHYLALEAVNELPADSRVLFLWEPRSYYCDWPCQPDSILDAYGHAEYRYGDAAAMSAAWRAAGFTHLLLFQTGLDFVLEANAPGDEPLPEPAVLQALKRNYLTPLASIGDNAYRLYRLTPAAD